VRRLDEYVEPTAAQRQAIAQDLKVWKNLLRLVSSGMPLSYLTREPDAGDIHVWSDASGTIGLGAYSTTGHFFQQRWSTWQPRLRAIDIHLGEMLALVLFARALVPLLRNQSVTFYCDNMVVVGNLQNRYAADHRDEMNALVRALCLDSILNSFHWWVRYIPTSENTTADALSRFKPTPPETRHLLRHQVTNLQKHLPRDFHPAAHLLHLL
jgi:hypothetical protein